MKVKNLAWITIAMIAMFVTMFVIDTLVDWHSKWEEKQRIKYLEWHEIWRMNGN